jgi:hypothetical protein
MFVRPSRRWRPVVLGVAVLAVVAVAVALAMIRLRTTPGVEIRGTFTMFEPLACNQQSPSSILRTELVFMNPDETEVGRATASTDVRLVTETVRGFVHCRESGQYHVRVKLATSYAVAIPQFQETLPAVSYKALAAASFRYDFHY